MKENKYRAWLKDYGHFAIQGEPDLETLQSFIHHYGDLELEQFTGLIDKNGKEIFEGDILTEEFTEYGVSIGVYKEVVYDKENAGWSVDVSLEKDRSYLCPIFDYFEENIEVVGNIHQNKDLLCQ